MDRRAVAIVLFMAGALARGSLWAEKQAAQTGLGGSVERRARGILEKLEKERQRLAGGGSDYLYVVDFDGTMHARENEGPIRLEPFIDERVIMKSLLDRAEGVEDEYSEKIRDFLVARAVELGSYRIDSFSTIRRLFREDENFRKDVSKRVGAYFERKAAPNHRIAYLLEFGCSRDQIEFNYTNMSREYIKYYEGIEQNSIVIEIVCQLLQAKKKVVIFTDNSEANVLVASHHLKLEETMRKRLAELGTTLDPKIPIMAGETNINGILPIDLNVRPLIPIVSMFKRRPKVSEHFFEISTKRCPNSREVLERELAEKYDIDAKDMAFVVFDDNQSILDNLRRQGMVPVLVNVSKITVGSVGSPADPKAANKK
ncbi:MAG: hypothetical protein LBU15_01310 [Rickettsiales bacterium]|jgi:hypothetical protein|nr:hypothetical protein [Rickettsiales bacterium]